MNPNNAEQLPATLKSISPTACPLLCMAVTLSLMEGDIRCAINAVPMRDEEDAEFAAVHRIADGLARCRADLMGLATTRLTVDDISHFGDMVRNLQEWKS